MAWRFAIVVLAGCWTSAGPPPPAPVGNTVASQPRKARPTTTTWEGQYQCAQGVTALRLTLRHTCMPDGVGPVCHATGTFEFGPHAQNPSVPAGAYEVAGEVRANVDGELLLVMEPQTWIEQPFDYEMVGFTARTDRARETLEGRIDNVRCGSMELRRAR